MQKKFLKTVLFENISAKVNDKDKVGILGINGIGKTTLIKILVGEEICDIGAVEFVPIKKRYF